MIFSRWQSNAQAGQAAAAAAALPWQRARYWWTAVAHPLASRYVQAGSTPQRILLQADLGVARAAYLREHRLGAAAVLPASALLELAAAACALLTEDSSAVLPALAGIALASRLQGAEAEQEPVLLCAVDTRLGEAEVLHSGSAAPQPLQLLACAAARVVQPGRGAAPAAPARRSLALAAFGRPALGAARSATADVTTTGQQPNGLLLPPGLCEAVSSLEAAGGGCDPQLLSGCELLVAQRDSAAAVAAHLMAQPLEGDGGGCSALVTSASQGGRSLELRGMRHTVALPDASSSCSYVVSWKRIPAGQADARQAELVRLPRGALPEQQPEAVPFLRSGAKWLLVSSAECGLESLCCAAPSDGVTALSAMVAPGPGHSFSPLVRTAAPGPAGCLGPEHPLPACAARRH